MSDKKSQLFSENAKSILGYAFKAAVFLALGYGLRVTSCTDKQGTREALENFGKNEFGAPARYTPLEVGGFGFGAWDHVQTPGLYSTRFKAIDTHFKDTVEGIAVRKLFSDETTLRITRTFEPE